MHANLSALQSASLLDVTLKNHPRYGDARRLLCHGLKVCSQGREDGMIREVFRRVGSSSQIFVEIGVGDGIENNTAFLLSQGWSGFWVDGDPAFVGNVRNRQEWQRKQLQGIVSFVTRENVKNLLEGMTVPKEFDFLSIDIDQNTYYVWEALAALRPRVVVVEYNSFIPPDVDWKVAYDPARVWDGTHNFGASLKAFELLGKRMGYSLVGCDFVGANAFFVRSDLVANKFVEPFTAENHYEPPRCGVFGGRGGHPSSLLDGIRSAHVTTAAA